MQYCILRKENPPLPTATISLLYKGFVPLEDIFLKKGKYGFVNKDNTILPAQFTEATPFKGGYAKVKKNGKYGVLKLSSGNFQGMMVKNTIKVENGKSETANYRIQMPTEYLNKPVKVEIEEENSGNKIVLSPTESGRDGKEYAFIPTLQDKETEKSYLFSFSGDSWLILYDNYPMENLERNHS